MHDSPQFKAQHVLHSTFHTEVPLFYQHRLSSNMTLDPSKAAMSSTDSPSSGALMKRKVRSSSSPTRDKLTAPLPKRSRIDLGDWRQLRLEELNSASSGMGMNDTTSSTAPEGTTEVLVGNLLKAKPGMLIFEHSLQELARACHSYPPGEVSLAHVADVCRQKGANEAKIHGLLTQLQPALTQKVAVHLATLIKRPDDLRDVFNMILKIVGEQKELVIPRHVSEALQAILGGVSRIALLVS